MSSPDDLLKLIIHHTESFVIFVTFLRLCVFPKNHILLFLAIPSPRYTLKLPDLLKDAPDDVTNKIFSDRAFFCLVRTRKDFRNCKLKIGLYTPCEYPFKMRTICEISKSNHTKLIFTFSYEGTVYRKP